MKKLKDILIEKLLLIGCIMVCIILLLKVFAYAEQKIINSAFWISNEKVNESYNLLADKLISLDYNVNMVDNGDETYSIIGTYEDEKVVLKINLYIDKYRNILENTFDTKLLLTNIKDIKYQYDKNSTEILNYYILFNKTMNVFKKTISLENFEILFNDASNYNETKHGQYQSDSNIYEVYKENKYIHIKTYLRE